LRNEYNREVLGRGVLTSEELIARIHQAQKDFDDFTGLSTIVTLPGGGIVMKGGLKLAARVLQIRRVAREGTKLLTQFSKSTIDDAVSLVMKDPNKVKHLFPAKHNLGPLVNKLGGQQNTVRAVLNAANGKLPASGLFRDIPVRVGGQTVFIRGNVINGVPRLGTMFIP
ncbi:MAG: hypothetical protein AAF519_20815, partial [Bacteroidota bacterium]